jgi:hypothetical protein
MRPHSLPAASRPRWVRLARSEELHAIAWRFLHLQEHQDLTERQEWLWHALIDELERRWRRTRPAWQRCNCALCRPPF